MGCVVVTEPFDLTVLVEDTRSTCKSDANPFWQHLRTKTGGHIRDLFVANGIIVGTHCTDSLTPSDFVGEV